MISPLHRPSGIDKDEKDLAPHNFTMFRGLLIVNTEVEALIATVSCRISEIDIWPRLREEFDELNPPEEMPHALKPGLIKSSFQEDYAFGYQFNAESAVSGMWIQQVHPSSLKNWQLEVCASAEYANAAAVMGRHTFE